LRRLSNVFLGVLGELSDSAWGKGLGLRRLSKLLLGYIGRVD
jgi:hypothetical protein